MTDGKNTTHTILWDLHRLPGFDFMKFAQVEDIGNGKQDLFISLEGQKTWFRLACPNGALVLNALRVTDTMAIFEARVFADSNDRNPLASFTATQKADKAKGDAYIRAAQDAALEEAMKNAGFCLQISTLAHAAKDAWPAQVDDAGDSSETPKETAKPSPAPVQADAPKQKAGDASQPPADKAATPPKTEPRPAPIGPQPHAAADPKPVADTAPRPAPVGPPPHDPAAPVVDINTRQPVAAEEDPTGQSAPDTPPAPQAAPAADPAPEAPPAPAPVTYTADMTVDEITARMTLEQAQSLVVKDGTCKGWTLAQVAKDRPTSLRWLQGVCPFADNELKAAATIVLNDLELKMAG